MLSVELPILRADGYLQPPKSDQTYLALPPPMVLRGCTQASDDNLRTSGSDNQVAYAFRKDGL